jgi:hypothetical protein
MRIIPRNLHTNYLHQRLPSASQQKLFNGTPSHHVVHTLHQSLHLLLGQTKHSHHAEYHRTGVPSLVEDTLLDHLGDLAQINGVVQLVVDVEEGRKGLQGEGVARQQLCGLAESQISLVYIVVLLY